MAVMCTQGSACRASSDAKRRRWTCGHLVALVACCLLTRWIPTLLSPWPSGVRSPSIVVERQMLAGSRAIMAQHKKLARCRSCWLDGRAPLIRRAAVIKTLVERHGGVPKDVTAPHVESHASGQLESAVLACGQEVRKLGVKFETFPPGPVIIKETVKGRWAELQGLRAGTRLTSINGRNVTAMSEGEFNSSMQERPLRITLSIDPRHLTSEMTLTTSAQSLVQLISIWVDQPVFNAIHMATAFYRLAVHSSSFSEDLEDSPVIQSLVQRTIEALSVNTMSGRPLSNTIWAIGKLRHRHRCFRGMLPSLIRGLELQVAHMTARQMADVLYSVALLRKTAPEAHSMISMLLPWIAERRGELKAQELANVVWSAGVLRLNGERIKLMLSAMYDQFLSRLNEFSSQELANACWGFVVCGIADRDFMAPVVAHVIQRAPTWRRRDAFLDLPGIACAQARIRYRNDEFLQLVASTLENGLTDVTPWNLCALSWTYQILNATTSFPRFCLGIQSELRRLGIAQSWVSDVAQVGPEEGYDVLSRMKAARS